MERLVAPASQTKHPFNHLDKPKHYSTNIYHVFPQKDVHFLVVCSLKRVYYENN